MLIFVIYEHHFLQVPTQITDVFPQNSFLEDHMRLIKPVTKDRLTPFDLVYDDVTALFGIGTENDKLKIFLHSL